MMRLKYLLRDDEMWCFVTWIVNLMIEQVPSADRLLLLDLQGLPYCEMNNLSSHGL